MILRRIADALRRQDWTQVIIELIIVIVGIFLGLQVDDWNTERQNKIEGNEYLSRLYQDLEYDIGHFEINRRGTVSKIRLLNTMEKIIKRGDTAWREPFTTDTGVDIEIDLFGALEYSTAFAWSFPNVRTTTFVDMQNSGAMALINDPQLRFDISYYFEESLNAHTRTLARITGYPQKVYELVDGGARTTFAHIIQDDETIYDAPDFDIEISKQDFIDRAKSDPDFLNLLRAEKNYATFLIVMIDDQLSRTTTLMTAIETYLEEAG